MVAHYYWDACVFIAYLNKMDVAYGHYLDHIGQFLEDARNGDCTIYTSTMSIAEITDKRMAASEDGDFNEFLADYTGAIVSIAPDPNVMSMAAAIKGITYAKSGGTREVGTPDAIHLASALSLIADYGVALTAFHTFDDGKSKGLDGKAIPLLSFETWCDGCKDDPVVSRVISLPRKKPDHPDPKLPMPLPVAAKPSDIDHVVAALPTSEPVVANEKIAAVGLSANTRPI